MQTNSATLEKDSIQQPELWKLALAIGSDRIDVGLYPPLAREEIMWRSFTFDPTAPTPLRAVEDIIYDNPLLFSDFKRVDCIINNVAAIPLPKGISVETAYNIYTQATACGEESISENEIEFFDAGVDNAQIALIQQRDIRAFLLRTFYNARFDSAIASLCRYFAQKADAPKGPAIYAPINGNRLTLIALDGRRLLMANEFKFEKEIDAVYYILAVTRQLGLDPTNTPVFVSPGMPDAPEALLTILTQYMPLTEPIPFPTLRYRASKSTLQAPLSLTIRPLCE